MSYSQLKEKRFNKIEKGNRKDLKCLNNTHIISLPVKKFKDTGTKNGRKSRTDYAQEHSSECSQSKT